MKLKRPKSCGDCRAVSGINHPFCDFGYNNRGPYVPALGSALAVPQEPCPKPRTIKEYIRLRAEGHRKQD